MADLALRVTDKMTKKLILASKSPRRRGFFDMLGLDYTATSPDIDESADPALSPREYVEKLAKSKALAIDENDAFIIAADTVVGQDGVILGKPKDKRDAENMLRSYSDSSHEVITGFAIRHGETIVCHSTLTKVYFKKLTDEQIISYINTDEPYDKAGGYAVQGRAALYIAGVTGDWYSVVGLPIHAVKTLLEEEFDIRIKQID